MGLALGAARPVRHDAGVDVLRPERFSRQIGNKGGVDPPGEAEDSPLQPDLPDLFTDEADEDFSQEVGVHGKLRHLPPLSSSIRASSLSVTKRFSSRMRGEKI